MVNKSDKDLLEEFIINNKGLERLENIVNDFNIFTSLNLINNEIRHSYFLSWLMNPKENHNLKDYFLSSLLKVISMRASSLGINTPSIFDIDNWSFIETEVLREWRNIDILIKDDNHKLICVIENKIYSKEHSGQLRRYKEIVEVEYPDYQKMFVYLTIEGDEASEDDYLSINYHDIIKIISHIIENKSTSIGQEVLIFISHYREMFRRYIMENSEIQEICRKIYKKHKKALDLIFEYKPDLLMEINECLTEIIKNDPDLILDFSSKSYIRFITKKIDFIPRRGEGWTKSERILLFEFKNNLNGVALYLIIGPGSKEIREKLCKIAKNKLKLFNVAKRKFTGQWFSIYKKTIVKANNYEDKDISEIKKNLKEKIESFKINDLVKIEKEIEKFKQIES
ncbi:MAG: PDDEXK-like family protein [Promethearchaeota archaeon]